MEGRVSQPQLRRGGPGGSGLVLASAFEHSLGEYEEKETAGSFEVEVGVGKARTGGLVLETEFDVADSKEQEAKRWPRAWLLVCCLGKQSMVTQVRDMLPVAYRMVVVAMVWLTVVLLACQRLALTAASFPIFDMQYRWNRFDQAVFLCAPWLGGMLVPLVAAVASANTKHLRRLLVAFLLAATCLNCMMTYVSSSYYEMWVNRFFAAVLEGAALAVLLQVLWQWVPRMELPIVFVMLWAGAGVAVVVVEGASAATFEMPGAWMYLYAGLAAACALAAAAWASPLLVSWPARNSMLQYEELAVVVASRGWAETKLTRASVLGMANSAISSVAVWRLAAGAACYGWLLAPMWSMNAAYFLEQASLSMNMVVLPAQAKYPWLLWLLVLSLLGGLLAYVRNRWSVRKQTVCLATLEAIGAVAAAVALFRIGDYHTLKTTVPRYCNMAIGAALASGSLVASLPLATVPISLPILVGILTAIFSASGYLSLMLLGNILDMAGAWSICFEYQAKLLLIYVALGYVVPMLLIAKDMLPYFRRTAPTTAVSV